MSRRCLEFQEQVGRIGDRRELWRGQTLFNRKRSGSNIGVRPRCYRHRSLLEPHRQIDRRGALFSVAVEHGERLLDCPAWIAESHSRNIADRSLRGNDVVGIIRDYFIYRWCQRRAAEFIQPVAIEVIQIRHQRRGRAGEEEAEGIGRAVAVRARLRRYEIRPLRRSHTEAIGISNRAFDGDAGGAGNAEAIRVRQRKEERNADETR